MAGEGEDDGRDRAELDARSMVGLRCCWLLAAGCYSCSCCRNGFGSLLAVGAP